MREMIKKTIELLKEKVKSNLIEIQNNQREIRNLLKKPVSAERSAELEEKYSLNKILLAENNDFINVQLTLTNFLEKYNASDIFENEQSSLSGYECTGEKDCFELTVNGVIPFDTHHPFFNDDNFFQKLLHYYQELEDYEKCSKLVKEKNQQ
ncbi:MAG TPA: hypothetical protein VIH57_04355 [Bacteroidales bacterium]|jgi:hypothetical protein